MNEQKGRFARREAEKTARRETVARLLIRQLTLREIVAYLEKEEIINSETGKPYELSVISKDRKAIVEGWRESTLAHVDEHQSRIIAELGEVKRKAWQENNLPAVLKALAQESEIFPVKAAVKSEQQTTIAPSDTFSQFLQGITKIYGSDSDTGTGSSEV